MVKKNNNSGTGYEDGPCPFVLLNRAVFGHKTTAKLVFSFDSIVWSLVTSKSRVCNDIVGVNQRRWKELKSAASNL